MNVSEISAKDTWALRNEILRAGQDISTCVFAGDEAPDTRHFGAIDDEANIVGIVSVYSKGCPAIQLDPAYQLRAMATSPRYRGRGVGRLLLAAAENYVKEKGALAIWANARTSALGFYINAGYQSVSEEFMIEGIGPHYLVVKSVA